MKKPGRLTGLFHVLDNPLGFFQLERVVQRLDRPLGRAGQRLVELLARDVGGGFGAKIGTYPEELLLGPISKALGRPVRWRETRSESMMALGHGRAQVQYVTIGGTRDGKVTHYQLHAIQDAGYFAEMGTILAPFMTRPMSSGVYAIPNIECRTTSVVTNTTPIVAYRGAGRPEA